MNDVSAEPQQVLEEKQKPLWKQQMEIKDDLSKIRREVNFFKSEIFERARSKENLNLEIEALTLALNIREERYSKKSEEYDEIETKRYSNPLR